MVSENYFLELDKYIATSTKPVLLEIFYWLNQYILITFFWILIFLIYI
jgi:hypothetical protein